MLKPDYQKVTRDDESWKAYCTVPGKAEKLERLLLRITQQQQSTKNNNTRYYCARSNANSLECHITGGRMDN